MGLEAVPPTVHQAQIIDGQAWSISVFPTKGAKFCAGPRYVVNGQVAQAMSCGDQTTMFADHRLVLHVGGSQARPSVGHEKSDLSHWSSIWVWGVAAPDVSRITLQLTDCQKVDLPLDEDGVFLFVTPVDGVLANTGPQRIQAFDSMGSVIDDQMALIDPPPTQDNASSPQATKCG